MEGGFPMDVMLATMEWRERIATAPFVAALVILIIGECCLYCDLAGRVLGTYVRTVTRIVVRNLIVVAACTVLAVPFLLALFRAGGRESFWLALSTLLSLAIAVQYLFPYRFGIRRIDHAAGITGQEPLAPGVILRHVCIEASLPPECPGSLRCLVLSDLHCTWRFNLRKLRACLASLDQKCYHMVFVLGDLGESNSLLPEVVRTIGSLRPTHGIFCVRGNHDFERHSAGLIADLTKENAITLLPNVSYPVPGLGIEIVGLEWPWSRSAVPSRPQAAFSIGLTHTPDNITAFSRLDVPLALAGHTHDGKLRLPWIGSFPVPSKYGRFLDEGWFQLRNTRLYITRGLGHFPGLLRKYGVILDLTIADPRR
jgi:hypothetical protein